jgi:glycerate-2-kinase
VKGGGLVARLARARTVTLVVSDVAPGRAFDVASGPTLHAPHDTLRVVDVVARYGLASKLPAPVLRALEEAGAQSPAQAPPESPGTFRVLLDNESACVSAASAARSRRFAVEYARDISEQPVDVGAAELASRLFSLYAREAAAGGRGVCLISGGEFSCPVRGGGTGGRNSETALRVAFEFEEALAAGGGRPCPRHLVALCAGTDGIDGNSPAAGALADETTLTRARALGLDAREFLDTSDAHTLFDQLGDSVDTGPTGTNVRDVRILLAF